MTEHNKAGNIVIQIGTATVRMDPVGFSLYAEEFFIAGASIPENSKARGNTSFTPVPYYLFCRALELILKAFLLTKNKTLDELRKKTPYGHNLEALWAEAKNQGLLDVLGTNGSDFDPDLRAANSYYYGKTFEYFDLHRWARGYEGLPPLARFRDEIKRIIEKTKEYCLSVA